MIEPVPNSKKFKEEQAEKERKKVDKVIQGTARTRKKSELSKLSDIFISEDVSNVKSYVLMDVLVPAIKKAISDIVTNGIDMILYGESGRKRSSSSTNYVSYRDYSKRDDNRGSSSARRSGFEYDDILFDTKGEAEAVIDQMQDMIDRYGVVRVDDMYDMAGLTAPYTSHRYGWTSVRNAESVRVRDGYIIKMPRAMPID